MSLRKILDTFTLKAFGRVLQGKNKEYYYKQVEQQILALIPKKMDIFRPIFDQFDKLPIDRKQCRDLGFNQAISETKQSMTGEK